jgi:hypothetical protein
LNYIINEEGKAMGEKMSNTFSNWHKLSFLFSAFVALFLLVGCAAGGNYGKLERSRDLDNMFLNYEVLPDHRYYTFGGFDAPDAILAIHMDYELDNSDNLWVPIPNVDSAQMRKWIDTIAPEQDYRYSNAYFAAYILNLDGKKVGAWYSVEVFATVKFLEGNKIEVWPPSSNEEIGIGIRRERI